MILDSSAVIAILKEEPAAKELAAAIVDSSKVSMSAATFLETSVVIDRVTGPIPSRRLDLFVDSYGIVIEPFTSVQAQIAREAYRDFGRGSGHPANLNFGDCFAYALAKDKNEPLLFVGDDFDKTDVEVVSD